MKTWKEYYLECKDIYNKETKIDNSNISIYDLLIQINPFPTDQTYFDQIFSIQKSLSKIYKDKQNYHTRAGGIALCLNDVFIFEKEIKIILENYLVPYLEKDIFGCYVQCQNVKIYKTTSEVEGIGMKQDDDILRNYTVAKTTMKCDFLPNENYILGSVVHNGVTYKTAFIGCTYHCG